MLYNIRKLVLAISSFMPWNAVEGAGASLVGTGHSLCRETPTTRLLLQELKKNNNN